MITGAAFSRVTIRAALFAGFTLIFGVCLAAGYYFLSRLADLEGDNQVIASRSVSAENLLMTARQQILLAAVYARDALLDGNPSRSAAYQRQMTDSYAAASRALQQYVPLVEIPADSPAVARLQQQIADYQTMMLDVLATHSGRSPDEVEAMLRNQVTPRRLAATRIVEEMAALNRHALVRRQTEAAALYKRMQRQIEVALSLALLTGIGIATLATLYAGRLERHLRLEQAKAARKARDLQRLSARLTTVQEEERRTIARELHDEVGQLLTALKMELAIADRTVGAPIGSTDILQDARLIADGALHTVRDLSRMLHPSLLDDLGLPAAVDCYVKGFGRRHGLQVELLQDGMDERLPPQTEIAAYRVVQEALTNVAKHAQASTCKVRLERGTDTVSVTVEDDGTGFDLRDGAGARIGLGLIGIRERASQLKGTLRLESATGKGTKLTVLLPAHTERLHQIAQGPITDLLDATLHG